MRYLGLIAAAVLWAGFSGANAQAISQWKLGVGAQTSAANMADYHMGYGGGGAIAVETNVGDMTESRVGLRGNYLNYEPESDANRGSFQEFGGALEALVGPTGRTFEPKVGGHVGYQRVDDIGFRERDALDVGADFMANIAVSPQVDIQAVVTPLWLIDSDDTDYQTRGSIGVQFGLGPGV